MAILSAVSRKGSSALSRRQTAANAWSIAASVLGIDVADDPTATAAVEQVPPYSGQGD